MTHDFGSVAGCRGNCFGPPGEDSAGAEARTGRTRERAEAGRANAPRCINKAGGAYRFFAAAFFAVFFAVFFFATFFAAFFFAAFFATDPRFPALFDAPFCFFFAPAVFFAGALFLADAAFFGAFPAVFPPDRAGAFARFAAALRGAALT